ncbi:MAG: DUF2283 domain-containing protein [Candidatus Bathycorpusculaceae bacterium]
MWFDSEGDMLEIGQTKPTKGFFREVGDDIFIRVDQKGNITGFVILNAAKRMAKIRGNASTESHLFQKEE